MGFDSAVNLRKGPGSRASARHRLKLPRYWDIVAVLLLIAASVPPVWLSPKALTLVRNPGFIDDNWHLDAVFKASRGIWVGRDVAFTHGPLFQWLSSLPGRAMGVSSGAIYPTWDTVPLWCAVVFGYLALCLLLPEQPPWKRFLLLLLLCIFWGPSLRMMFAVLVFAVFLRGWYAVAEGRREGYAFASMAALLLATAFLVAADQGIYAIAALVVTFAGVAIESRRFPHAWRRFVVTFVALAVCTAVLVFLINCVFAKPFSLAFWRDSFAQVSGYRWATPFHMTSEGALHLFGTLAAGAVIFLLRAALRHREPAEIVRREGFLLGGFAFAVLMLQSGLVRADTGHIVSACYATIFLSGAILFSFESPNLSMAAVMVALLASVFLGEAAFRPSGFTQLYAEIRNPLTVCPAGFREFDRACYTPAFSGMLQSAAGYLQQRTRANDSIVVFPYQTRFGLASRRNVAGGLMQPYTASGAYLSNLEITGLERASPAAGLYLPDPDLSRWSNFEVASWRNLDLSLPVDGVANFTRAPEVWFWLLHHYRAQEQLAPGLFGLQRDDSRVSGISMKLQPLGLATKTYPVTDRSSTIDLGAPSWPSDADFLQLHLMVHYGILWKLRKPERMQVEITRADGSRTLQWFVLEPNVATDVWFYPWSAPDLAHYFDPDESHWRTGARPAITRLRLIATPLDWVSQTPDAIEIEAANAVRVTMSP